MTDVHSKETRSYNMSRIRSKDTKPEMLVRRFLHSRGFRFRLHAKDLPGKPDVVLPKYKTVIFVHGCFWHSHKGCSRNRIPKNNKDYWVPKLLGNVSKDERNKIELSKLGWRIYTIWECDLKKNKVEDTLNQVSSLLTLDM